MILELPEQLSRFLPTSVEPVKVIRLTSGWFARAFPMTDPEPGRMFNTPAGIPASRLNFASLRRVRLVSLAGFTTTQLPDARIGASF